MHQRKGGAEMLAKSAYGVLHFVIFVLNSQNQAAQHGTKSHEDKSIVFRIGPIAY